MPQIVSNDRAQVIARVDRVYSVLEKSMHDSDKRCRVFIAVVKAILAFGNAPVRPKEIANCIKEYGFATLGGRTPHATVSSRLSLHFTRVREGKTWPLLGKTDDADSTHKLSYFLLDPDRHIAKLLSDACTEDTDNASRTHTDRDNNDTDARPLMQRNNWAGHHPRAEVKQSHHVKNAKNVGDAFVSNDKDVNVNCSQLFNAASESVPTQKANENNNIMATETPSQNNRVHRSGRRKTAVRYNPIQQDARLRRKAGDASGKSPACAIICIIANPKQDAEVLSFRKPQQTQLAYVTNYEPFLAKSYATRDSDASPICGYLVNPRTPMTPNIQLTRLSSGDAVFVLRFELNDQKVTLLRRLGNGCVLAAGLYDLAGQNCGAAESGWISLEDATRLAAVLSVEEHLGFFLDPHLVDYFDPDLDWATGRTWCGMPPREWDRLRIDARSQ